MFIIMKYSVTEYNSVAHCCMFKAFWETMEVYGIEKRLTAYTTVSVLVFSLNI